MSELITIHGVRGFVSGDGTVQVNLEDVARGLGFTRTAGSGNTVVRWERVNSYLHEFGFMPTSGHGEFIPESIFYRLAMKAKNDVAEAFQIKVANEILPSIRKHGAYMTPETIERTLTDPDFIIRLATKLKEESAARKELETKVETDRPKVLFAEAVTASKTTILIGELAKIIKQNGIDMGQNRLFVWMRENGFLISRKGTDYNMPTQRSMDLGLFEIKETSVSHSDGHITISKTPKVTGKGQVYFINKFKEAALV